MNQIVELIGQEYTKDEEDLPEFGPGDTVRVSVKVVEGGRERIQVFEGIVIRKRNSGVNTNFTVRRIGAHGVGVERTFLLHSPRIDKIEVSRFGIVHRAALYYLRGRTGKAARIKERKMFNKPAAKNASPAAVLSAEAQPSGSGGSDTATQTPIAAELAQPVTNEQSVTDATQAAGDLQAAQPQGSNTSVDAGPNPALGTTLPDDFESQNTIPDNAETQVDSVEQAANPDQPSDNPDRNPNPLAQAVS